MRIAWIGCHQEGLPAFRALLDRHMPIVAAMTLPPALAARRSGAGDYRRVCAHYHVPLHEIANINDPSAIDLLTSLDLDLIFVIGWNQLLRSEALRAARMGAIGAHASLLPAGRGRAPINWALIHGSGSTGNTLFWLTTAVDAGDIIDQTAIPISPYDTCATLYRQVAISNRDMILRAMPALLAGERPGRPQGEQVGQPLPSRRPEDGLVDWSLPSAGVYNFVRAISRPYPGAFTYNGADLFTIWRCALLPAALQPRERARAGEVLGPMLSPDSRACGQVVACGDGAVVLQELQQESGETIRGRALSDLDWTGLLLGPRVEALTE
jgi:methionyl-tRNA formyltransferase